VTIIYHNELIQGTDEWLAQRCGLLTASEIKHIITPTLKVASNDKERAHLYELLAQRVSKYVEPQYVSDGMLRGEKDELIARELYSEKYAPVTTCGFVTNDELGFIMGYSPDGLVGDDGLIEIKSRKQALQMQTIIENVLPAEFMLQVQSGLMISKRKWLDFISFSGGMPMFVLRVLPDLEIHKAIAEAACVFEARLKEKLEIYLNSAKLFFSTERTNYEEVFI
jgi:YqaJ-like viral recombinase domain